MKEYYDIVVIGGGPAGCYSAKVAAEMGASVLVLEKDREIGVPVRCAEGIGEKSLSEFFEPDPRWIANRIEGFSLASPDGTLVDIANKEIGYILERRIFDREIARCAIEAGAVIRTRATASSLLFEDHRIAGVRFVHLEQPHEIKAKLVIGADGVESRVGRWAGLRTACPLRDMEICAQYAMANLKIDPTRLQLWFGHDIAPGGYLWIFPKSATTANVGVGISGDYAETHPPFHYLEAFIQKHLPNSAVTGVTTGAVPCSGGFTPIVTDGLMLVGDAAHQANPLSGGGIATALKAAHIAGRVAAEAVQRGNVSQKRLMAYQKEWMKVMGRDHRRFYRLKEAVYTMTDETMNQTAHKLSAVKYPKRTLIKVFQIALFDHPKLLLDVPRLFFQMG